MASRDINELLPCVRARAAEFNRRCDERFAGTAISVQIVCTWRDPREQDCLYLQGRASIDVVNRARALLKMPPIMMRENIIRTKARPGQSAHEYRCAFDALAFEGGKILGRGDHPVYQAIGEIGESCGLEWSGRWKGKIREAAHFQYLGGLTITDLQKGKLPV